MKRRNSYLTSAADRITRALGTRAKKPDHAKEPKDQNGRRIGKERGQHLAEHEQERRYQGNEQ